MLNFNPDEHRANILQRVAIGVEATVFKYKVQRYFFTNKREWSEIVDDKRFSFEYLKFLDRYKQYKDSGDFDWLIADTGFVYQKTNQEIWQEHNGFESEDQVVVETNPDFDIDTMVEIADVVQMPVVPHQDATYYYQDVQVINELPITIELDIVGKQLFYPGVTTVDGNTIINYQGNWYTYLENESTTKLAFANNGDTSERIIIDNANGWARKHRVMLYSF
jgi:hypothetical protein